MPSSRVLLGLFLLRERNKTLLCFSSEQIIVGANKVVNLQPSVTFHVFL